MPGMKTILHFLLAVVLISPVFAASWMKDGQLESLKIIKMDDPLHPLNLLNNGVLNGYATIIINVSAEGRLTDLFAIAYSHKEFADAAMAALQRAEFDPARINGIPVAVNKELQFVFEAGAVLLSLTGSQILETKFNSLGRSQDYRISTLAELDRLPAPIAGDRPIYYESLMKRGIAGKVLIEFIIDQEGHVRFTSVVSADHNDLAALASDAIKSWRFESPRIKGVAVAALAQQLFDFQPDPNLPVHQSTDIITTQKR